MKRVAVFIMLVALLFAAVPALADTVRVKEGETQLNYRTAPDYSLDRTGYIEAGQDYEVTGAVLSWAKVIVEDAKRGKVIGWVGAKILEKLKGKTIIGGDGCTLRTKPKSVKSTEAGYLWPKSVVIKHTDSVVNFYKIKVGDKEVYVSARYCVLKVGK